MVNNELINILRKILDRPYSLAELKQKIPERYRVHLRKLLNPLVHRGEIVKIRGGRFGLPDKMSLVVGTVQGHPDGYGFVIPEEPEEQDIFIGPKNFRKAMHGDRVVCRVESVSADGKRGGSVIRVLERAHKTIVGIFEKDKKGGVVIPGQRRITQAIEVSKDKTLGAENGQAVRTKITGYPDGLLPFSGEVIEILGIPGKPEVEKKIILREYDLPEKFPEKVERAASKIKEPGKKDLKGRLDLRDEWIITIDGETARDFDDAVSIKEFPGGFELGVHIADVSHYVRPGTPLYAEAFTRGNSTYFPDSVIPMLPFHLSNNICSLKPGVERLTVSAIMKFDRKARMTAYRFVPSVIKSRHRMTYTNAAKIIKNPHGEKDREMADNLSKMKRLCDLLHRNRNREGSLDFDLPEPLIILDMQGEPEEIIRSPRNEAHRFIEEFMLAANRAAAIFLDEKPSIYRVHPEPDPVALKHAFDFAKRLGHVSRKKLGIHHKIQDLLEQAVGKTEEKFLNYIILRSMKQASYSVENIGHFGLAFSHYTHFTSPIRRFPDLVVHRLIKAKLANEKAWPEEEELMRIGVHCSATERNSETAERDIMDMWKVRFIADRVGEEFEGIISGVTAFGIFVELNEIFAEGLLRLTNLFDDYYDFHEKEYALIGKRTKKIYRLGAPIKVRIKSADIQKKQIDLEPAGVSSSRRSKLSEKKQDRGKKRRRRK